MWDHRFSMGSTVIWVCAIIIEVISRDSKPIISNYGTNMISVVTVMAEYVEQALVSSSQLDVLLLLILINGHYI